ncbi:cyanidin 3-O-rutinoside 5-O-glucosyltransferase-like [Phragmites australis]|uniref:cyanidin 3-O-rutinoside 5-O-glucosyltransferase-like n=1 Tax=Phragmites australis TaxID=29695 RepID=UPI002D7796E4|nr:cyanidin 3-O-rutinoside 5-O-glucosyltransferase-like [Phragmites australis]
MADEERRQQHNSGHHEAHKGHRSHHFLVVAHGIQSHVNPGRALVHRLTRLSVDGSILATLSVPIHTHRRMFPSLDGAEETTDGVITYVPHSDGLDDGSTPKDAEGTARRRRASAESLSAVVTRFAARGQPVTCIICTMVLGPVLDVAQEHDIPLAFYWTQPAIVLAAYYHYFHGHGELIASHAADLAYEVSLPGLSRPVRIRDFPSVLVDTTGSELAKAINEMVRELFEHKNQWRPKVLVNTFDELEATVLAEVKRHLDVFAVGPMVGSSTEARIHLFKHDDADKKRYMEWLGAQPEMSVVYASFGSVSKYSKQQIDERVAGLRQCGRPYLLVVRKDGLEEDAGHCLETVQDQGMVVEWCNQLEVLSHPAVGCFVTHCGWNSTMEAVVSGVPIVGVPNMFDQPTNAYLVEEEWAIGTRGERNSDGVLTGTELARCIELVMGEGAKAMAVRARVKALKGIAQEVADEGGRAERNLRDFVTAI